MLGIGAHIFNPITQQAEAGDRHSELQESQDYIQTLSQKAQQTNKGKVVIIYNATFEACWSL